MRKRIYMWPFYLLIGILIFLVISAFYISSPIIGELPSKPENIEVSSEQMKADVYYLADSCFPRNFDNQPMLNKAADFVQSRLEEMGYETELQNYEAKRIPHKNIIARIGPETDEIIVLGAHYDVCGDQAGADDNGSAVAGLLAIAELLKKHENQLKTQVELVAYSLEEPPFFRSQKMGSYIHAESLSKAGVKVKAMICLEMIGYFSDEPKSQNYPIAALKAIYPSTGNFITVVGQLGEGKLTRHFKKYMKSGGNIPVESINAPKNMQGIDLSDHRNYWHFDFPAVMITDTSFFRNPNYHQTSDTPETLDYDKMAEVAKGCFWAILNL